MNHWAGIRFSRRVAWSPALAATLILLAVLPVGCSRREAESPALLVFAAASLTDALSEAGVAFEEKTGSRVDFSFGGSQMLARQIAAGAPADLLVAAGEFPVDLLKSENLVEAESARLLTNRLVAVIRDERFRFESVEGLGADTVERVAIADPQLAPAGRYAREALESLGVWNGIQGKLVFGPDVRSALTYVATGNADVAIAYETDARGVDNLIVLDILPSESYRSIVYPAAIVGNSERKREAETFLEYLLSGEAGAIFRSYGFDHLGR